MKEPRKSREANRVIQAKKENIMAMLSTPGFIEFLIDLRDQLKLKRLSMEGGRA